MKKGFLSSSTKFTGKHLYQGVFFNKIAGLSLQLYEKRDSDTCFPVNFAKFLRTPFLTEHLWWLLLIIWLAITFYDDIKKHSFINIESKIVSKATHHTFTCSKWTIETVEKVWNIFKPNSKDGVFIA